MSISTQKSTRHQNAEENVVYYRSSQDATFAPGDSGPLLTCQTQTFPVSAILLSVCLLLYYSILPCQDTHCETLHEQQKRFRVIFENEHTFWREYTMLAPAQLLRSRYELRLSNQGDLDQSAKGKSIKRGGPGSDLIYVPQYMFVLGLRFKLNILYCNCLYISILSCSTLTVHARV